MIRTSLARLPFALAPLALATAALAAPGTPAAAPAATAIGSTAPSLDAKMTGVDGRSVSIGDTKGAKGTVVFFICNHCPFVKAWQDRIVALGNGAAAQGLGAIAINANDPAAIAEDDLATMKQVASAKGYHFPYVVDAGSRVARAFGASRTPEVFVLDASNKVVYHGAIDDNGQDAKAATHHYVADAIQAVSAGKPVAVAETKAMGCGIKFCPPSNS